MELKKGMKVKGEYNNESYTGSVYSILGNWEALIKRDDGRTGGGSILNGYGALWIVIKNDDGTWGANGNEGKLKPMKKEVQMRIEE